MEKIHPVKSNEVGVRLKNEQFNGVKKITIKDKEFPEALKTIKEVPKVLYFIGKLPEKDELCFAIVGTRRCSNYGKQVTLEIAGNLADLGITIISGLAPGIDTFAHKAVVERTRLRQGYGGRAIAVLGTGIDEKSMYPKENFQLANEIVELGGCLISEYPPGTRGTHFTFPQRNRIISGFSLGVLVIEAKEKSGSLITANYAFSQKRKLFAVPGPIYSLNARGPNSLIKQGAKLVDNTDDILQELNLIHLKSKSENKIEGGTPEETLILEALKEESLYVDKIIKKTKLSVATVASILTILELEGKVRNLGGNFYTISR